MEFKPPVRARIVNSKYAQFGLALSQMGLRHQEFRATKEEKGMVFVHPEDWMPKSNGEQQTVRRDFVEFPES